MERIGALETICRYPVKSMAGEELGEAFAGFAGVMGDRTYAFVRTPGPKGFPWHTGREQEDLILYRPRYRDGCWHDPAGRPRAVVRDGAGGEPDLS